MAYSSSVLRLLPSCCYTLTPMALFKSSLLAQASGSLAGTVFSHNRGGQYMRNRSIPTNPSTARQASVREALSTLVYAWSNTLSEAQRTAWTAYADNTPVLNRLGDSIRLTGQQMFVRCGTVRLQAGLSAPTDGPTTPGLAESPNIIVSDVFTGGQGVVSGTVPGAGTSGAVSLYMGRPVGAARSPVHVPERYVITDTTLVGNAWSISVEEAAWPFTPVIGQVTRLRAIYLDTDGRISASTYAVTTIVPET